MPPFLLLVACSTGDNSLSVYNAAPVVSITNPPDGSSVAEAELITLAGLVDDDQTGKDALLIQWTSTIDGVLQEGEPASADGETTYSSAAFSVGNHTITLAATDDSGLRGEAAIQLTITDVPDDPTLQIVHPVSGESGRSDQPFTFGVKVSDEQDDPTALIVVITSDLDPAVCSPAPDAAGEGKCDATLSIGVHHLRFTVTDSDGLSAVEEYVFTVVSGDSIDDDGDGWTEAQGDCNDGEASVKPGQTETLNTVDDDCDGIVDDNTTGYDDDGDGQTEIDGDCDDADADRYGGAAQTWDGKDNDCDSVVDEGTEAYDDDGDGFAENAYDCDDANAAAFPGATEIEDAADNDCDGIIDEGTAAYDDDGDGFSEKAGDCDDDDDDIHPDATEDMHNYVDEDCNGIAEEDFDGDGFLTPGTGGDDCDDGDADTHPYAAMEESDPALCYTDKDGDDWADATPTGSAVIGSDCDDGDSAVNPDAIEECDGQDNDCDGSVDEANADGCSVYYYDYDGDGYGSDSVSGSCLCTSSGYYTSRYDTDCYDYNSSASPAAATYKTSQRGDGSYDWDCDGTETKYWDTKGACGSWWSCTSTPGWSDGTVASCGTSESYMVSCSWDIYTSISSCTKVTSTYTQKCL